MNGFVDYERLSGHGEGLYVLGLEDYPYGAGRLAARIGPSLCGQRRIGPGLDFVHVHVGADPPELYAGYAKPGDRADREASGEPHAPEPISQ
jgi:hypothetical protein